MTYVVIFGYLYRLLQVGWLIIIIIIIPVIIFLIIFMQGIYSHISDTYHVFRVYRAAATCRYNVWYK